MTYQVTHGLPEAYRAAAAELYWQAFGGKLGAVMGPPARAQTYLRRVMQLENCIAAMQDNSLLGIVGLHGPNGSFAGGTARDFGAVYGRLRGLWRLAAMVAIGGPEAEETTLSIDGFSVQAEARGQGIGAALLGAAIAHAQAQGFSALQLDVVGSNWRARAFYLRHGFAVHSMRKTGPLGWIFGFDQVVRMRRDL